MRTVSRSAKAQWVTTITRGGLIEPEGRTFCNTNCRTNNAIYVELIKYLKSLGTDVIITPKKGSVSIF